MRTGEGRGVMDLAADDDPGRSNRGDGRMELADGVVLAVVVIDVGFLSTTKHSVVEFVWLPGRYFEPAAGVYSIRKQYVAMLAGVKASEVAVPPASVFVPRLVPPVEQSGVEFASKQVKNSTVPVAVPLLPVIVTVSVTESPIVM